jgi:protein-S-isoprenylcysteine O-methyltransferase Ste14
LLVFGRFDGLSGPLRFSVVFEATIDSLQTILQLTALLHCHSTRQNPMPSEDPFRIALLMILGFTMVVGGYHRWQAAKSGDRISRKEEGLLLAVSLRLAGLCVWIATLAYLIDPAWMEWAHLPLASWLRWLGAVFGLLACALMYWTLTSLGKNLTDTVVTRANATLVTTGPYRWIRHPFYLTVLLLVLAVTLLTGNWFIGLCGLVVFVSQVIRTPNEEQKLIDKFGDQYRAYMAVTGRFLPKM